MTLLKCGNKEISRQLKKKPIAHSDLIGDLNNVVQLPSKVAIVKVKGHATGESEKVRGNQLADASAKEAAKKNMHKDN